MGLNQFSDLTNVEFEGQYFNSKPIKTVFQCNGPDAPYKTTFDANFTRNGTGNLSLISNKCRYDS